MNKKTITIIVIVIAVVIAGTVAYVALRPQSAQDSNSQESSSSQTQNQQTQQPEQTPPAAEAKGQYVEYDPKVVAGTEGRKLLFFHAAWCPQCRELEKTILGGTIPSGMTIFKVNYDTETSLRQKYGVTLQTTIVEIDDQGNEVKKYVAYDDPNLQAVLNAFGE